MEDDANKTSSATDISIDHRMTTSEVEHEQQQTKRIDGNEEVDAKLDDDHFDHATTHTDDQEDNQQQQQQQQQQQSLDDEFSERDLESSVQVAVRVRPLLAFEQQGFISNQNTSLSQHHNNSKCVTVLKSASSILDDNTSAPTTVIRIGGQESGQRFTFDRVYDSTIEQNEIYTTSVVPLLNSCLHGYNATILAYGQTGSGKTHTMMGPLLQSTSQKQQRRRQQRQWDNNDDERGQLIHEDVEVDDDDNDDLDEAGIIPRAFSSLFDQLEDKKKQSSASSSPSNESSTSSATVFDYQVSIQFLELYGEEIRDLLSSSIGGGSAGSTGNSRNESEKGKLTIRDLGTEEPEVVGAMQHTVLNSDEALFCLHRGMLRRVTGATAMNESSSRSHAILTILIEQQQSIQVGHGSTDDTVENHNDATEDTNNDNNHVQVTTSRFNFVDLAGSERQKRTLAVGKRLKEGIDINKGLLVLGNVISALGDPKKRGKTFVPYRDSKLTRLLKGSLGGNHKTLMIACISPSSLNMEESLNCLRYANRAKNIQNNAIRNVDSNSKLISDLQSTVHILSSDIIRIIDNGSANTTNQRTTYPREVLESWASGAVTNSNFTIPVTNPMIMSPVGSPIRVLSSSALTQHLPQSPFGGTAFTRQAQQQKQQQSDVISKLNNKINEMEIQLSRTQEQLRATQQNHDSAEEALYIVKAQKELSDLQLSVLQDKSNTGFIKGKSAATNNLNTYNTIEDAFMQKTIAYETEIGQLRASLVEAQSKIGRMQWIYNHTSRIDGTNNNDENPIDEFIEKATKEIETEKTKLLHQQQEGTLDIVDEEDEDEILVENLTKKYGKADDDENDNDDNNENDCTVNDDNSEQLEAKINEMQLSPSRSPVAIGRSTALLSSTPSSSLRERRVQANLAELSRSIASKENLIDQLKLSQEKYASMRDFYEERLRQMEQTLNEKEREREELLVDLKRSQESGNTTSTVKSKDIEEKLGQKEKHIADLRKRKQELVRLTAVSSRNDTEIRRLHDDVQNMKRLKVDLQKKLSDERKAHLKQMKDLEKNAIHKDKELSKMKRITTQREVEATRSNQLAKQRMDELAQLRMKYKDSEKKLRMASLKRGVLAKAGIDNVIVGRREGKSADSSTVSSPQKSIDSIASKPSYAKPLARGRSDGDSKEAAAMAISVDSIRTYFDQKVAGVVRKEAIADKLAREWEEHFELSNRKQELMQQKNTMMDNDDLDDAHQALLTQIQFKEERIRQLAAKLGKPEETPEGKQDVQFPAGDAFLFGKEFASLCKGTKPDKSHVAAARVLFGMIVRERRRVAALARTASSLDERVQDAERLSDLSETALRSYMEDQRKEIANLTQNQQEHILSLMEMVKDDSILASDALASDGDTAMGHAEDVFQRKLLVLSNERVTMLERQIQEMSTAAVEKNSYCEKLEETKDALSNKLQEYDDIQREVVTLRDTLRHVEDLLSQRNVDGTLSNHEKQYYMDIKAVVQKVISPEIVDTGHRRHSSKSASPMKTTGRYNRSRGHLDTSVVYLSESDCEAEGVDDTPEWADDIMADLALIAMGVVPPSLVNAPAVIEGVNQLDKMPSGQASSGQESKTNSVFDRLSDPKQWTGTQKRTQTKSTPQFKKNNAAPAAKSSPSINQQQRREARKLMTKEITSRLDKISVPPIAGNGSGEDGEQIDEVDGSSKPYQSVFDRLVSPSHYTGTQKEKFQETKQKRERTADQIADRVLDGILQSKETTSGKKGAGGGDIINHVEPIVSRNHALYTEYARQDVFERLQKTTTQAFAVKTHPNAVSAFEVSPLNHQESSATTLNEDEGIKQSTSPANDHSSLSTGEKNVHTEYMRQDVFERLQRTTTEAYAKKTNSKVHI